MTPATTSLQHLNEDQRKSLIDSIQGGNCILVLGPYANLVDGGFSQQTALARFLANELPATVEMDNYERDSLADVIGRILLYTDKKNPYIRNQIKNYYQQQRMGIIPDSPYDLIPKLGFKTILNADPYGHGRLLRSFGLNGEIPPTGLYFSFSNSQLSFMPDVPHPEVIDRQIPLILNLFGLPTDSSSLAVGPDDELQQQYTLTSDEVRAQISQKIGDRLAICEWYLCVGFNFNSWALASTIYFFSKLTKNFKDARIVGLHSLAVTPLPNAQVVYYKNLFPNATKSDILIDNLDAQTFFTELNNLVHSYRMGKRAFVVFHPGNRSALETWFPALKLKLEDSFGMELRYSQQPDSFSPEPPTEAETEQHILNDDLVLFLISSDWVDQYDQYFALARQRARKPSVVGLLVDEFSWRTQAVIRNAIMDDALELRNTGNPLSKASQDQDALLKGLDEVLEQITTAD